jgi:PAS domain S-box-containing protein
LKKEVAELRRTEQALRANELNFQLTVDSMPGMVHTITATGAVEFVNHQILDFFGKTVEELNSWDTRLHPDDRSRVIDLWTHSVATGEPFDVEVRALRADGTYRWLHSRGLPLRDINGNIVRWHNLLTDIDERKRAELRLRRHDGEYRWFLFRANPLRDEEGNIVKWYGISTDIEDRKRAEDELRRAYDHLAEAQRLSQTGSFTSDLAKDEHHWSEEFYRICEFEPGSTITIQRLGALVHPEDVSLYEGAIQRASAGTEPEFYFRIVTARGVVKHLRGLAHRIADRPVFVGAVQDVTATRVAEDALNKARSELAHVARVATLSTLTASIAHEINQPLSGIITNAGTCLRMLDSNPPNVDGARETARRTIRDGNRAADVVTRLRALFSKKDLTLEPLDLNEATREVIALSSSDLQRNRVILQSELADDLPAITGDRIQLQQVILNLLRNASDAMVGVRDRPRRLLIRTERESADRVRLTVRDAGVGLDRQSMDKLFDAFYTTKSGGMGIGLSVSRSIVEGHHGRLWAEPNDGPGASFLFSLPRSREIATDAATVMEHA